MTQLIEMATRVGTWTMDRLIYTAMTGASQTLNRQAAVAHNLANVSTTGYRAEEHRLRAVQVQSNAVQKGLPTRAFVVDASTHTDFAPGPLIFTGTRLRHGGAGAGLVRGAGAGRQRGLHPQRQLRD
jgi:flagellar basal-body rod protein FlgF